MLYQVRLFYFQYIFKQRETSNKMESTQISKCKDKNLKYSFYNHPIKVSSLIIRKIRRLHDFLSVMLDLFKLREQIIKIDVRN